MVDEASERGGLKFRPLAFVEPRVGCITGHAAEDISRPEI
jgi:hypothetical protein